MSDVSGGELKFENDEELEAWLKTQPREVSVVIAARAALRVLPTLHRYSTNLQPRQFADLTFAAFWASALARVAAKYPTRANELRAAYADAAYAAAYAADAAANSAYAAHAADSAAYAARAAAASAAAYADAAYAAAADAAAYAAAAPPTPTPPPTPPAPPTPTPPPTPPAIYGRRYWRTPIGLRPLRRASLPASRCGRM